MCTRGTVLAINGIKSLQQNLERFKKDKVHFVRRFITIDETWVYHHDPECKQDAKEWCESDDFSSEQYTVSQHFDNG